MAEIYETLLLQILDNINIIQFNAKILSQIDVVSSHSTVALENNYCKPTF